MKTYNFSFKQTNYEIGNTVRNLTTDEDLYEIEDLIDSAEDLFDTNTSHDDIDDMLTEIVYAIVSDWLFENVDLDFLNDIDDKDDFLIDHFKLPQNIKVTGSYRDYYISTRLIIDEFIHNNYEWAEIDGKMMKVFVGE